MKVNQEIYSILLEAMRLVVQERGKIPLLELAKSDVALGWYIYWAAQFDLMFDDTHPAFMQGRRRIIKHSPEFREYDYDADLNDAHWQTAILKALKELGLHSASKEK